MPKFTVTEITEIRANYVVEAKSSSGAIRKVRKAEYDSNSHQTIEQKFISSEIKEENQPCQETN